MTVLTRTPVVLFMFKRVDSTLEVLAEILKASPEKLYLIADGPRDAQEAIKVATCRQAVEEALVGATCAVVKNYADVNRGVYENIAGGARWVFERESRAIFLEDDTVPDPSFFPFCEEMLERYSDDQNVLMVYGTNYLERMKTKDGSDYVFTQHMLPCGWASWDDKFLTKYDGELNLFSPELFKGLRKKYTSSKLHAYDLRRISSEYVRKLQGERYLSWDYQLAFSLRVHNLLGIAPTLNLISNIGDDLDATHGGTTRYDTMTRRFCGIPTHSLTFPLNHPRSQAIDRGFEGRTTRIVLPPSSQIRRILIRVVRRALGVPSSTPTREALAKLPNTLGRRLRRSSSSVD